MPRGTRQKNTTSRPGAPGTRTGTGRSNAAIALTSRLPGAQATGVSSTASGRVYESLRTRIITLELPPDTVLSRVELAQEYGVSQSPIREAMQRLEQDGLILIYPQSKTVVSRIDIAQLNEAHFLRVAVELEVVRTLALGEDQELLNTLDSLLDMQAALVGNERDYALFQEMDDAFHHTLFAAVGQQSLHDLLRARAGHLARARSLDLPTTGKRRAIMKAHRAIVEAIRQQDPSAAESAMRDHLSGTVQRIDALQAQYPDYFLAIGHHRAPA